MSVQRDLKLIRALVTLVMCVALCRSLVWAVDGLSNYVPAIRGASVCRCLPDGEADLT